MERMIEVDQAMLLLSMQTEMAEMKRKIEEVTQKNEQEIQDLRKENEEMKKKLLEGGPSIGPSNLVGRFYTSPPNPKPVEETKDKAPTHEMDGESCVNKSAKTTVIGVPLPDKWKGFNKDRYDGFTDPDEHIDAYTTHMSLYTLDDAVLCRVFPTSLKGSTLRWFTKLPPNSINSFATLVVKFET